MSSKDPLGVHLRAPLRIPLRDTFKAPFKDFFGVNGLGLRIVEFRVFRTF